jgi:Tol biopolymer transport system component
MRRICVLILALVACSRAPDEVASSANALSRPLSARLASLREVAHGGAMAPQLSPDGQRVAFTGLRYQGIRVAPAAGGEAITLTDEPAAGLRFAWSPDSSRIAYVTREPDSSSFLRVIPSAGGATRTIHHASAQAPYPLARFEGDSLLFLDGDRLRADGRDQALTGALPSPRLFARTGSGELLVGGDRGIFVTDATGAKPRALFEGKAFFDFVASPDGATVLARELRDGGGNLWSLDRPSGRVSLLAGFDRGCVLPSGLVVAERIEGDGLRLTRGEVWLMRPDGSGAVKLEGAPGAIHHRVDCAAGADRIAMGEDATDAIFVADVEVRR